MEEQRLLAQATALLVQADIISGAGPLPERALERGRARAAMEVRVERSKKIEEARGPHPQPRPRSAAVA
jgi:hypothetical protein